jgi:hypothetical protein
MRMLTPTEVAKTPIPARNEKCAVVVLYEGTIAHDKAMEVCGRLTKQFGDDVAFEFTCWKFARLEEAAMVQRAHAAAACADVILVATHGDDLPVVVRKWLAECANRREKSEGAISVLFVEPISPSSAIGSVLAHLQSAAQRLNMDFLPLIPLHTQQVIGTIEHRERTVASLLSDALPLRHSSHYGLND